MQLRAHRVALASLLFVLSACSDATIVAPSTSALTASSGEASALNGLPTVRFSELHYDNVSTDVDERIEVSGPAGQTLDGWSVVLYNGANGSVYNTRALSGTIPATCDERGVLVLSYPANGIQNGNPDGLALVNAAGVVVEFLSYGGTFAAVGGAADGLLSVDIGVSEGGTTPVGSSLARGADGVWASAAPNSFGTCNDDGEPPPPADVARIDIAPATASVFAGATLQLVATAFDADNAPLAGVNFSWESADESVATVSNTGLVTGVTEGAVQITARAPNGASEAVTVTVTPAPPPSDNPDVRFSEIHYDNAGADVGEAIEIEGTAGTDVTGWQIVLYNGGNNSTYSTRTLSGIIPSQCEGRGTIAITYPANGIQNGPNDGFALVNASGVVIEFLSYEGTITAANGPAAGLLSIDIGANEPDNTPVGRSLQRDAQDSWVLAPESFGRCNALVTPPPAEGPSVTIFGRDFNGPALPVGFEDQIFARLSDGNGAPIQSTFVWSSETPELATVNQDGVVRALAAGSARIRATASDGTTRVSTIVTAVATRGDAVYANNIEFGRPVDGDSSDDFIVSRKEFTASWNPDRGIPNWVSYNLDASHFGEQDRCECYTFDPQLPASFRPYTTADYTGATPTAPIAVSRGHLARSLDRTAGSLDNANVYYFTNIVPQSQDLNSGPWAAFENYLGDLAEDQNKEVFIITGATGDQGTLKNEGIITIPEFTWKVAVVLPRDQGLSSITSAEDLEVIAVYMPNINGIRGADWRSFEVIVDSVEARSGYNVLTLLRDDIETAVESNTRRPAAATNGPYAELLNTDISMSAATSTDPDGDALTFAWSFGDGTGAVGESVVHRYAQAGTYTVRLIATDVRGLADTVTTIAEIESQQARLADAIAIVNELERSGTLNGGLANALNASLSAAVASYDRGDSTPALNQLGAFRNKVSAFTKTGKLPASSALELLTIVNAVIASSSTGQ